MPRLKCLDEEVCGCLAHKTTEEYLPCCPRCSTPLVAHKQDPEYGFCLNNLYGYQCRYPYLMIPPASFKWVHRHDLSLADIPFTPTRVPVQIRQEALQ